MGGNCTEPNFVVWSNFWLQQISVPVFGTLGIFGNCIAVMTLRHPTLKTTFHQSLTALAICDIWLLIMMLIDQIINKTNILYVILFPYFWNPVINIVMSSQICLLMSIATERFLGVWMPMIYRTLKPSYSKNAHLIIFVLPSILFSTLINIPKFFETKITKFNKTDENNTTREVMDCDVTNLRLNQDYIFYYTYWTQLIFTGVIPLVYLTVMNSLIFLAIRKKIPKYSSLRRKITVLFSSQISLNRTSSVEEEIHKTKFSRSVSITLVAINVIFCICHFPRLLLNFIEFNFVHDNSFSCARANWFEVLMSLSVVCLTINSCANCIIYYLFWKSFKNAISKIFLSGSRLESAEQEQELEHVF